MVRLSQLPLTVLRRMLADTVRDYGADSDGAKALRDEIARRSAQRKSPREVRNG